MPARPRLRLVGAGLIVAGLVLVAVAGAGLFQGDAETSDDAPSSIAAALAAAAPARDPFPGLTETRIVVGHRQLRVVLADSDDERVQGLRVRDSLGPYDGMLFVYQEPVASKFTMSTVPVALDVAFYDGQGRVISRRHMTPCSGPESACPVYGADGPFVDALETLADHLPKGRLR